MKLHSIQILRGIAAFLVVMYHIIATEKLAIAANGFTESTWVSGIWTNGYAGVDLFFVISGFIMVYVTGAAQAGRKTALAFFYARATRIYPIWWVFAALMTIYMVVAHGLLDLEGEGWSAIGRTQDTLPYLIKSFLLIPQAEHPILGVGWTLVHEMHFYVVFTAMMLAPRRIWPWLLAGWAAIVIAGSLAGLSAPVANDLPALVTYPMTLEFILGAATGLLVTSGRRFRPAIITLTATFWMIAALCLQGAETSQTLMWGRVLWFGLPAAALIYGFASLDVDGRLALLVPAGVSAAAIGLLFQLYYPAITSGKISVIYATIIALLAGLAALGATLWAGYALGRSRPDILRSLYPVFGAIKTALVSIGDWSYALYLSHILVLVGLRRIFGAIAHFLEIGGLTGPAALFRLGRPGIIDNVFFMITAVTLALIVARISYRYIEKPLIRYFAKRRQTLFGETSKQMRPTEIRAAIW